MEQSTFLQVEAVQREYRVSDLPERERPVNRLREVGPRSLSDVELLACVLQTSNALSQARSLLVEVGGLDGLTRAESCMFEVIPGIGPAQAARLQATVELGRRIATEPVTEREQVRSSVDAARVLFPLISAEVQEHFVVLFLDTRNRIIEHEVLYKGSLNMTMVRVAEVFRGAIRRNCAAIIVAHNHPSGDPSPSPEDVALTRRLVDAGRLVEVEVVDHLVIGRWQQYVSLRDRGLGFDAV